MSTDLSEEKFAESADRSPLVNFLYWADILTDQTFLERCVAEYERKKDKPVYKFIDELLWGKQIDWEAAREKQLALNAEADQILDQSIEAERLHEVERHRDFVERWNARKSTPPADENDFNMV